MTEQITKAHLQAAVDRINKLTNSPMEPYTRTGDKFNANIGCYYLYWAYGGVQLDRINNVGGGTSQPLGGGFNTKREMYYLLHAFIRGLEVITC